jgi:acetyltransferase-like isoleucine patch superfamily enzyme
MLLKAFAILLPWSLRRLILNHVYKYDIHKNARIGFSWIYPTHLQMEAGTRIDHLTVAINLNSIKMATNSIIGRNNWITGYPIGTKSKHFKHQKERRSELIMGESASITKSHHLDCTNQINIGRFSTIAGYNSQFLTHSIDIKECIQDSKPIFIGEYTFIGTNVVVLGGSVLPSYSILGAKSLLNKEYIKRGSLYAGVPAKEVTKLDESFKYFNRTTGFVY